MAYNMLSPQGYSPESILSQTDISSPLVTFEPPLVPQSYNASTGSPPPISAWNTSVSDGSWSAWNSSTAHIAGYTSAFTSTPGASFTFYFLGTEFYATGAFSGQSNSTVNGTLEVVIDGHTITSDPNPNSYRGSALNASLEGFGFSYGSQLPGTFGFIGEMDYGWHEITVKLNQGWLEVDSITGELLVGAQGANTTVVSPAFVESAANGGLQINPSALTTTGTWSASPAGLPAYYIASNVSGSTLTFTTPLNTSIIELIGYAGPEAGNYSVTLTPVNGSTNETGTISWYGMAMDGPPSTLSFSAKRQWAVVDTMLYYGTVDQSKQYNVTVAFSGNAGERFAMNLPDLFVQTGSGTTAASNKSNHVGAIVGGVVGGVVVLALIAGAIWYYRRRQTRMKTSSNVISGFKEETEMNDLKHDFKE